MDSIVLDHSLSFAGTPSICESLKKEYNLEVFVANITRLPGLTPLI